MDWFNHQLVFFHDSEKILRQAKGLDLSFPLLCDYDGRVAKAFGAYLELEEQGGDWTDREGF